MKKNDTSEGTFCLRWWSSNFGHNNRFFAAIFRSKTVGGRLPNTEFNRSVLQKPTMYAVMSCRGTFQDFAVD
ncbi:hypothetical protein [Janthinobacterium sp. 64]|uniref:hypothetical protein n=1 Tax=Janthinobacterium sp. 64 TaxID=2035208 RepID=UPI0012FE46FF|nr:hypothetical protein [Janthinobacterium sp. 64]